MQNDLLQALFGVKCVKTRHSFWGQFVIWKEIWTYCLCILMLILCHAGLPTFHYRNTFERYLISCLSRKEKKSTRNERNQFRECQYRKVHETLTVFFNDALNLFIGIQEFPADLFTNSQRKHGGIIVHILVVSVSPLWIDLWPYVWSYVWFNASFFHLYAAQEPRNDWLIISAVVLDGVGWMKSQGIQF